MPDPLEAVVARPRTHINSLPVEVLAMIFLSITVPLWFVDGTKRPVWTEADMPACTQDTSVIVRVCQRWHSVAMATPGLWAWLNVRSCRHLSLLPKTIARSGNARLFLRLWTPLPPDIHSPRLRFLHPMQRGQWSPGLDALVQNMHRIAHINLFIDNWEDAGLLLERLRGAAAPILRYFMCRVTFPRTVRIPRDIFMGVAPQLQFLFLMEIFPEDWGSPLFTSAKYCNISSASASTVNDVFRARHAQRLPTVSDLALLLDAAPELVTLDILLFALLPSDSPISPRRRHYPKLKRLSFRLSNDMEGYRQLESLIDLSSVGFLNIGPLHASSVAELLSHLRGEVDLSIISLPGEDPYSWISEGPFYDDSYDMGRLEIRSRDPFDKSQSLELRQHDFRRDRALERACAPVFSRLTRLRLFAGQWPQVSAGLSRVSLPTVHQLVIQYNVERCLLGDSHGPFIHPIESDLNAPCETVHLYPLRGTNLVFPSLTEVILFADPGGDAALRRRLPLRATRFAVDSLGKCLSLDVAPALPRLRLLDVVPDDDDACAAFDSLSDGYTLEKTPASGVGLWWYRRFYEM